MVEDYDCDEVYGSAITPQPPQKKMNCRFYREFVSSICNSNKSRRILYSVYTNRQQQPHDSICFHVLVPQ